LVDFLVVFLIFDFFVVFLTTLVLEIFLDGDLVLGDANTN
jgi:hypothetical protein